MLKFKYQIYNFPTFVPDLCKVVSICISAKSIKVRPGTHPGIEGGSVAGARVVVALALWVSAAVDPDAASRRKLVARGAQHRVGRRRTRGHQKLWRNQHQSFLFKCSNTMA